MSVMLGFQGGTLDICDPLDIPTDKYPGVALVLLCSGVSASQFWRAKMRDVLIANHVSKTRTNLSVETHQPIILQSFCSVTRYYS
jgi:hypothetical protein